MSLDESVLVLDDAAREAVEPESALADTPDKGVFDTEAPVAAASEVVPAKPRVSKTPEQRLKKLYSTAEEYWRSLSMAISPEIAGETALQYLKRKVREGFPGGMSPKEQHEHVDGLFEFLTCTRCAVIWAKVQGSLEFFTRALPDGFIDPVQIRLAEVVAEYETSKDVSVWLNKASDLLADLSGYKPLCPNCGKHELRLRGKGPNGNSYFPSCIYCEDTKRVEAGGESILKTKPSHSKSPRQAPKPVTPKELVGAAKIEDLAAYFKSGVLPEGFDSGKGSGGKKVRTKKVHGSATDREGGRSTRQSRGGRNGGGRQGRYSDDG